MDLGLGPRTGSEVAPGIDGGIERLNKCAKAFLALPFPLSGAEQQKLFQFRQMDQHRPVMRPGDSLISLDPFRFGGDRNR